MKKSEVRARDGVEKKKKKTKKRAASSEEEDSSDEETRSDDEEYSDERDPKTGLLLKNSEVRRRKRAGAVDEDEDDDEPSGGADDMTVEDEEDEEDEGRLGDRDPATGILYTRSELRKMLRERLAGEIDDDQGGFQNHTHHTHRMRTAPKTHAWRVCSREGAERDDAAGCDPGRRDLAHPP